MRVELSTNDIRLYSLLDTVVISGDYVCCSVVFGVFNVMWSEVMTSVIICLLWSSVYECQRVECEFTSPVGDH